MQQYAYVPGLHALSSSYAVVGTNPDSVAETFPRKLSYCRLVCVYANGYICRAWQAEKQAMRERRLAQEAARNKREEAAKASAAAARAEAHHKLVEERKAKYVSDANGCVSGCLERQQSVGTEQYMGPCSWPVM